MQCHQKVACLCREQKAWMGRQGVRKLTLLLILKFSESLSSHARRSIWLVSHHQPNSTGQAPKAQTHAKATSNTTTNPRKQKHPHTHTPNKQQHKKQNKHKSKLTPSKAVNVPPTRVAVTHANFGGVVKPPAHQSNFQQATPRTPCWVEHFNEAHPRAHTQATRRRVPNYLERSEGASGNVSHTMADTKESLPATTNKEEAANSLRVSEGVSE